MDTVLITLLLKGAFSMLLKMATMATNCSTCWNLSTHSVDQRFAAGGSRGAGSGPRVMKLLISLERGQLQIILCRTAMRGPHDHSEVSHTPFRNECNEVGNFMTLEGRLPSWLPGPQILKAGSNRNSHTFYRADYKLDTVLNNLSIFILLFFTTDLIRQMIFGSHLILQGGNRGTESARIWYKFVQLRG